MREWWLWWHFLIHTTILGWDWVSPTPASRNDTHHICMLTVISLQRSSSLSEVLIFSSGLLLSAAATSSHLLSSSSVLCILFSLTNQPHIFFTPSIHPLIALPPLPTSASSYIYCQHLPFSVRLMFSSLTLSNAHHRLILLSFNGPTVHTAPDRNAAFTNIFLQPSLSNHSSLLVHQPPPLFQCSCCFGLLMQSTSDLFVCTHEYGKWPWAIVFHRFFSKWVHFFFIAYHLFKSFVKMLNHHQTWLKFLLT